MSQPVLSVDKDVDFSVREQAEWRKRGIETIRVDTMQEAIEKLSKDHFLFTAINADNVTYLPLLKILRDTTSAPILIIGTDSPGDKEAEALNEGADAFTTFRDGIDKNIDLAMAYVRRYTERNSQAKKPPRAISYGNLVMFYDYRYVFCNDVEIELTKKEFDLLYLFFSNPNISLEYAKISRKVWRGEFAVVSNNAIWQFIKKIRNKLEKAGFDGGIIKNIRDVGYRFSPKYSINN